MIALYKKIRPIIQEGDFYRLQNTSENDYHLYEYTKDAEGLVFAFLPQTKIGHRKVTVKLRGLKKEAVYSVILETKEIKKSGAYLMQHGFDLCLTGDYASTLIQFKEIERR